MKKIIIILFSIMSIYSANAQKYSDQYIKEASKVADNWFNDINNNGYENAFLMLSSEVKAIYNQESWISLINQLMLEFGELENRIVLEKKFNSKIEGLEDGFYVLIDYKSNYSNTINHNEYILLKQNDKRKWKIVDYNYEFENKIQ
jgi:hypothetical protein|tara:strand:+ start:441 stop:878 length:438 start_codon:yes stop_codon:yes gene_type:complete